MLNISGIMCVCDHRIHPGYHHNKQGAYCLTLPVELSSIREETVMWWSFLEPQSLTQDLTHGSCLVNICRMN